jgi:hypothetical protein
MAPGVYVVSFRREVEIVRVVVAADDGEAERKARAGEHEQPETVLDWEGELRLIKVTRVRG